MNSVTVASNKCSTKPSSVLLTASYMYIVLAYSLVPRL